MMIFILEIAGGILAYAKRDKVNFKKMAVLRMIMIMVMIDVAGNDKIFSSMMMKTVDNNVNYCWF